MQSSAICGPPAQASEAAAHVAHAEGVERQAGHCVLEPRPPSGRPLLAAVAGGCACADSDRAPPLAEVLPGACAAATGGGKASSMVLAAAPLLTQGAPPRCAPPAERRGCACCCDAVVPPRLAARTARAVGPQAAHAATSWPSFGWPVRGFLAALAGSGAGAGAAGAAAVAGASWCLATKVHRSTREARFLLPCHAVATSATTASTCSAFFTVDTSRPSMFTGPPTARPVPASSGTSTPCGLCSTAPRTRFSVWKVSLLTTWWLSCVTSRRRTFSASARRPGCLGSDRRASTTAAASNTPAATSCSSRRRSAARVPPRSSRTRAVTVPTAALAACTGLHFACGLLLVEASPPAVIAGMGESAVGTCAATAFACLRQARTGRRAAAGMSMVAGNRRPTGGPTFGAFAAPT